MNNVLETVNRCDFAFSAFVGASSDEDFVIFADWDRSDLRVVDLVKVGNADRCGGSRKR